TSSTLTTGSIRLTPNIFNPRTPSAVAIFSFQSAGTTVSESGFAADVSRASIHTYVETGAAESGIAISNTGLLPESVNLDFTVVNGTPSTTHASLTIPAGGQLTKFLRQIPGFETLPSSMQGILRVSSADN